MNISILLPYKENYSRKDTGAVSIFVKDLNNQSIFRKNIKIYGSTKFKPLSKNYKNLNFKKKLFQSSSKVYLKEFINNIKNKKIDILEIHNRPHYLNYLQNLIHPKKIIFFHNNPLEMQGSTSETERYKLLEISDLLVFNSNWTKNKFLTNLKIDKYNSKIKVIPQSTSKTKINFSKKKNIISFVGKLNASKGYDIFGEAVLKILDVHKNWKSIVIGNEPRQKLFYQHKNLTNLGFKDNDYVLKKLKEVSISIIPSRWDEPFGRSRLEAASRGCAIIRSDKGGLNETTKNSIVLKNINSKSLYNKINYLIKNDKFRKKLQKQAYKNFTLTNLSTAKKLDEIRKNILINKPNINFYKKKNLKILHVTNFNERFDGRLHYNTGKRINNGLIRQGHNILTISDRDIISSSRKISDPYGTSSLNKKILSSYDNFKPDILLMGHADNVELETLEKIKNKNKYLNIAQWFLDPVSKNGPDYTNNKKRFLKFINYTDANFITTDPKSIDFKTNNTFFIPNPADEAFETLENYKYNCSNDVFFAMSHGVHRGVLKKGKYDDREKILKTLLKFKNEIKFDFYGLEEKQPIWGNNFIQALSNCKMGLNISRGKPVKYYSSDRIAQLMGNGLLTFIHEKTFYNDFFNKDEMITYKNTNDLIEKIKKYKRNDNQRKKIARRGKIKYLKHFNSVKVSKYIINKTLQIKTYKDFIWDI